MDFYCRVLGMTAENCDFKYIVSLRGLQSEICLQRVDDELEEEVIGRLELVADEQGFSRFLKNRKANPFDLRSNNSSMELEIRDPDGNLVLISQQEPIAQVA